MSAKELVQALIANRAMRSVEEIDAFDRIIQQLGTLPKEPDLLPDLLLAFDEAEDYEVRWALIHYVEAFDMENYVNALIEVTPQLLKQAPRWLLTLYVRVLNNDEYRTYLKKQFSTLTIASQEAIQTWLERIPTVDLGLRSDIRESLTQKVKFVLSK